jgi:uncharacterized small protein (DUF1192 family)
VAFFGTFDTQRLTRADVQLVPDRIRRRWLPWLLGFFLLAAAGALALQNPAPFSVALGVIESRQQDHALRAELEHARLDLQMERATRAELQRRIQTLGDEVARLNQQLEFVNSRSAH